MLAYLGYKPGDTITFTPTPLVCMPFFTQYLTDWLVPLLHADDPAKGDPEQMELDALGNAAAADKSGNPPNNDDNEPKGPPVGELLDLTKEPSKRLQLLRLLEQQALGKHELSEAEQLKLTALLADAPLLQTEGVGPEDAKQRELAKELLESMATYDLLQAVLDDKRAKFIRMKRDLEEQTDGKWNPQTSPSKCLDKLAKRIPALDEGISLDTMQGVFTGVDNAITTHIQALPSASGLQQLQELLLNSKNKKLRKDLAEIRNVVSGQLKKLHSRAAECNAAGDTRAAGQCLAAYTQLYLVYKQQFLPLVQSLGVKGAADLVLQVGSPLSDITPETWQQLSSMASGGEYAAILAQLGPGLPEVKPKAQVALPKSKKRKSAGKSSAKSSESGSGSSSSSGGDETPDPKPSKKAKGAPVLNKDTQETFQAVARTLGAAIGQGIQRSLSGGFGGRGGGGRHFGKGGRGGGRSPRGKGDRGGKP